MLVSCGWMIIHLIINSDNKVDYGWLKIKVQLLVKATHQFHNSVKVWLRSWVIWKVKACLSHTHSHTAHNDCWYHSHKTWYILYGPLLMTWFVPEPDIPNSNFICSSSLSKVVRPRLEEYLVGVFHVTQISSQTGVPASQQEGQQFDPHAVKVSSQAIVIFMSPLVYICITDVFCQL